MTATDIFLNPGDWFVGDGRHRVRTLLGSCVSIVLWAPRKRIGAMSHFLLPGRGPDGAIDDGRHPDAPRDGRYGEDALALMLGDLRLRGVAPADCAAKIFGGGDMFPGSPRTQPGIGERNGAAARALLARIGVPVVSESLFGEVHRQVVFEIATGDVWARAVERSAVR